MIEWKECTGETRIPKKKNADEQAFNTERFDAEPLTQTNVHQIW